MRGVIAESHFDAGRNMVAMMKGSKRYILQPPSECFNIYLLPQGHPSSRHSEVNWSNPDLQGYTVLGFCTLHYYHFCIPLKLLK
jgi:hypothetical protein